MPDIKDSITIAGAGMKAQSTRMRIAAENIANADSTASTPGGDPYRRKTVTFKNTLDKELGLKTVKVSKVGTDPSEFLSEYNPTHPAADSDGYVKRPNINVQIEQADVKEAQRSYEANLSVIDVSRSMVSRTLELMR
ncbi:MAG: flagellar basal body rod protein FlgC [Proteobacteria bacterium]|nr:flagellar basal body rod protein FlgC [Pseudomonadota bacterium]